MPVGNLNCNLRTRRGAAPCDEMIKAQGADPSPPHRPSVADASWREPGPMVKARSRKRPQAAGSGQPPATGQRVRDGPKYIPKRYTGTWAQRVAAFRSDGCAPHVRTVWRCLDYIGRLSGIRPKMTNCSADLPMPRMAWRFIVQSGRAACATLLADAGERARRAARAQKFRDSRRAALQASAADAAPAAAEAAPAAAAPAAALPPAAAQAPASGAAAPATAAPPPAHAAARAEAGASEALEAAARACESAAWALRVLAGQRAAVLDPGTGGVGRGAAPGAAAAHAPLAPATVQPAAHSGAPLAAGGAPATPPLVCMPLSGLHAVPADTKVRRRA